MPLESLAAAAVAALLEVGVVQKVVTRKVLTSIVVCSGSCTVAC